MKLKDNIFITPPATRHSIVNAREKSVFAAQHFQYCPAQFSRISTGNNEVWFIARSMSVHYKRFLGEGGGGGGSNGIEKCMKYVIYNYLNICCLNI